MAQAIKRLSIVHVVAPAKFGGLETVITSLAKEQVRLGDRVTVVAVLSPGDEEGHPLCVELAANGVEVVPLVFSGRGYREERRRVRDILERCEAQVLHTHGYRPDVIDGPVGRRLGIPTVTTVHGYTGGGWKNRMYEWLQTRSFRRSDAVIAVSEKLRVDLMGTGIRRTYDAAGGVTVAGPTVFVADGTSGTSIGES